VLISAFTQPTREALRDKIERCRAQTDKPSRQALFRKVSP
jgi:hypothetical protein